MISDQIMSDKEESDIKYKLTEQDKWLARGAGFRQSCNGIDYYMHDKANEVQHRQMGVAAEIAYSKMTNKSLTINVTCPDAGWDILSGAGWKIDVKTTIERKRPSKLIAYKKQKNASIYVLLTYEKADGNYFVSTGDNFKYCGWAWDRELFKYRNNKPLVGGGNPIYQLEQSQLHDGFPP